MSSCHELTARECEILDRVASGMRNKQIAEELFIEEHTVETHLKSIFRKLRVRTRTAAAKWYWEAEIRRTFKVNGSPS